MLIHRDKSTHTPQFFTGQASCFCCPGTSTYHIRQYENDSGMAVLAEVSTNKACRGLEWDGTTLLSVYNIATGNERARSYDSSLADVTTFTYTSNGSTGNPESDGSATICLDGNFAFAANNGDCVNKNSSNTTNWVGSTFPDNVTMNFVVGDSSGNVYYGGNDNTSNKGALYKFNSSGTKVWNKTFGSTFNSAPFNMKGIGFADDGYIWCSSANGQIARVSTSGTVTVTNYATSGSVGGPIFGDGSTGIWTAVGYTAPSYEIHNIDSSGTVITAITDSEFPGSFGARFFLDSSHNVYGLVYNSSSHKVRKWNSSGSVQWTSGDIGWSGLTGTSGPLWIAGDATYIFVGGGYVS